MHGGGREGGFKEMDPISLVLAALLAGVAKGVGQSATAAVQDAYGALRSALKRRLADRPAAQDAVQQYTADADAWKGNLEVHLQQAGVAQDQAVIEAAARVMQLADPAGSSAGKYTVNLAGAQGVQVGDGNKQANYFGARPS
jgi:hypothetical protein